MIAAAAPIDSPPSQCRPVSDRQPRPFADPALHLRGCVLARCANASVEYIQRTQLARWAVIGWCGLVVCDALWAGPRSPRPAPVWPVVKPGRGADPIPGAPRPGYPKGMPRYEYRCRSCGATFELRRPMSQASAPAACPGGHDDTVKLLSTVAVTGSAAASSPATRPAGGGGGCCGGGCCG